MPAYQMAMRLRIILGILIIVSVLEQKSKKFILYRAAYRTRTRSATKPYKRRSSGQTGFKAFWITDQLNKFL
jgi:hypothetical protein